MSKEKPTNNQQQDNKEFVWNETVCSPEFSCIEQEEQDEEEE